MPFQSPVVQGIKGLSKKCGFECVESKAACCVSLTIASPEEGWKTSPFKIFQLMLESSLNKMALLTIVAGVTSLVLICLSQVSRAGTSHQSLVLLSRGGEVMFVRFLCLVSLGEGEGVHTLGVLSSRRVCTIILSTPSLFP
jgi:hypothetical protein